MPDKAFGLNSLADQRYYHFLVLRSETDANLSALWRRLGDVVKLQRPVEFTSETCEIQHRKVRSKSGSPRGGPLSAMSEAGDGTAPFLYDVFAARLSLRSETYLMVGFPFAGLALELSDALLSRDGLAKTGEVHGAVVPKVLATLEKARPRQFEDLSTRVVGVQFKVEDDKSLSAVRLGGDDPLGAGIYRDYIKSRVEKGEVLPDTCILACEKEWALAAETRSRTLALRSRLHADAHGNFKLYAQSGCANLRLLPYAIGQLRTWGALKPVAGNPLRRLGREDAE